MKQRETMRLHWHITGVITLFVYFLFCLSKTLSTLLDDTTRFVLSKEELGISPHNRTHTIDNGQKIPRSIHQVYLGWDGTPIPEHWIMPQQTCIDLHPDYEYMVITADMHCRRVSRKKPEVLTRPILSFGTMKAHEICS